MIVRVVKKTIPYGFWYPGVIWFIVLLNLYFIVRTLWTSDVEPGRNVDRKRANWRQSGLVQQKVRRAVILSLPPALFAREMNSSAAFSGESASMMVL